MARYIDRTRPFAIGAPRPPSEPTSLTAKPRIYLDHAATTPMTAAARAAMTAALADWANPSSPHAEGRAEIGRAHV